MRVMNHNWSATKQHLHPQSVAEISCNSPPYAILNKWYDISGILLNTCNTATLVSFTHFPRWYSPPR